MNDSTGRTCREQSILHDMGSNYQQEVKDKGISTLIPAGQSEPSDNKRAAPTLLMCRGPTRKSFCPELGVVTINGLVID